MKKSKYHGKKMTIALSLILVLIIVLMWTLFISGPARVHEAKQASRIAKIQEQNENIKGITEHVFDYVTYQGYDSENLYWYNAKSELITSRDISTLNYAKAKRIAKKQYKIKCDSITLGYGYNNPVYEIRGSNKLILLDYDSFFCVFEREA